MPRQRRVLLLSSRFTPFDTPAARRALGLYRHLPDHGWEPWVLTADPHRIWNPYPHRPSDRSAYDPSRVRRTGFGLAWHWASRLLYRGTRAAGRALAAPTLLRGAELFRFPDAELGWLPYAAAEALRLARERPFDAIVSTSPPPTAHLAARAIQALLGGRPRWIADYRDPWSQDETRVVSDPPLGLDALLERRVVAGADAISAVSPLYADKLSRLHGRDAVAVIPNGYDPDDFAGLAPRPRADRLVITHAGTNYPGFQDPLPVLRAVAALIREGEVDPQRIAIRFIGWQFEVDALRSQVAALGLEAQARIEPRRPRHELLPALAESSVLWALGFTEGRDPGTVPTKVYEYMGCQRFVLATGAGPDSDLARVLEETGAGACVEGRDQDEMTRTIQALYRRFLGQGPEAFVLDPRRSERFTQQNTARLMAGLLHGAYP